jgi:putative acetyltransferase
MIIRPEAEKDKTAIQEINQSAFETSAESTLVDILREQANPIISLIAVEDEKVVGHIMFSPITLGGSVDLKIMGLAPMAVLPEYQRKGIGSALVQTGLDECKSLGFGGVVVLGHVNYYTRFGFIPSTQFGINCEYDVPEEAFMVIELQPSYLAGATGQVKYHSAFSNV